MNKKSLKELVKKYLQDNNRLLGIFMFVFILMFFMYILFTGKITIEVLVMVLTFLVFLVFVYWKVFYIKLFAFLDIKNNRFNKKNIKFVDIKEDKSWVLWNSNPKNSAVCKYIAFDEDGNMYRLCTTCNYQDVKAIHNFLAKHTFRIVSLGKSKLIISIQANPAETTNKKERNETIETVKSLFGPFCVSFTYKNEN